MKYSKTLAFCAVFLATTLSIHSQSYGCLTHVSNRVVSAVETSPGECVSLVELCLGKNQASMVEMDFQINYSTGALGKKYNVAARPIGYQLCHTFEFTGPCNNNISLTGYGRNSSGSFCGAWSSYFPLPVELISFEGRNRNEQNCLEWEVTAEEDIDRYILERSDDGKRFVPVAQIEAVAEGRDIHTYAFCDPVQAGQIFLYRLAIRELSGELSYSSIISIQPSILSPNLARVWPIPSSNMIFLEKMEAPYVVYDSDGRSVSLEQINSTAFSIEHLVSGTYFVRDRKGQSRTFIKK